MFKSHFTKLCPIALEKGKVTHPATNPIRKENSYFHIQISLYIHIIKDIHP